MVVFRSVPAPVDIVLVSLGDCKGAFVLAAVAAAVGADAADLAVAGLLFVGGLCCCGTVGLLLRLRLFEVPHPMSKSDVGGGCSVVGAIRPRCTGRTCSFGGGECFVEFLKNRSLKPCIRQPFFWFSAEGGGRGGVGAIWLGNGLWGGSGLCSGGGGAAGDENAVASHTAASGVPVDDNTGGDAKGDGVPFWFAMGMGDGGTGPVTVEAGVGGGNPAAAASFASKDSKLLCCCFCAAAGVADDMDSGEGVAMITGAEGGEARLCIDGCGVLKGCGV